MKVYENGREIGTLQFENDGLYSVITCKVEPSEQIRRVYLARPYVSEYLGIPNRDGAFKTRISRKHLHPDFCAVATSEPKGAYLPWRGELDGVLIDNAWISAQELLIPADEAMNFPGWDLENKEIDKKEMTVIPLNSEGMPQPKEREAPKDETMDLDDFDFDMPADVPADDGIGGQGWEADRTDL